MQDKTYFWFILGSLSEGSLEDHSRSIEKSIFVQH